MEEEANTKLIQIIPSTFNLAPVQHFVIKSNNSSFVLFSCVQLYTFTSCLSVYQVCTILDNFGISSEACFAGVNIFVIFLSICMMPYFPFLGILLDFLFGREGNLVRLSRIVILCCSCTFTLIF